MLIKCHYCSSNKFSLQDEYSLDDETGSIWEQYYRCEVCGSMLIIRHMLPWEHPKSIHHQKKVDKVERSNPGLANRPNRKEARQHG